MKVNILIITTALIMTMTSCKEKADLILINGNIYTVNDNFDKATAFAIRNGKFVCISNDNDILEKYTSDNIIDIEGKSIYPGFIDGHCHFAGYGENKVRYADLRDCHSFDEVIERLKRHQKDSEWLLGRGWDQNLWEEKVFPNNEMINSIFPNKKVLLTRIDGHAVLVSDNVISMMNFDNENIDNNQIVKDKDGNCTGILLDNAADMAKMLVPPLSKSEKIKALKIAEHDCIELGLTGVTDAGLDIETIELIDSLQECGSIKMKINAMINSDDETMDYFMSKGIISKERLTVRSVKIYADGALGSRGAKLIEPYHDAPDTDGFIVFNDDFYDNVCKKAYDNGFQVCIHAIGDGGVRKSIDIYSKYLIGHNDLRWRIEHSQVVHPNDLNRYNEYNIIPSIQATHCTSDMPWAEERLGERIKTAYIYKDLLKQNGWIINGTDFPIEQINPLYTFYASVSRKNINNKDIKGFQLENALSREETLKSMTLWAAKGSFEEKFKGSIECDKYADFVILEKDIMTIDKDEIPYVKVNKVFINGECVKQ